jgi:hypothetical protein
MKIEELFVVLDNLVLNALSFLAEESFFLNSARHTMDMARFSKWLE